MSMSLGQFNKTVQELHNEGNFSTAVETFNLQEKSRQEEYKMKTKERELEIEQLKNHALRENQEHQRQMEKAKFENAKKTADYQEQLRRQRRDQEMAVELQKKEREEELKRQTILYEQEQQLKNEDNMLTNFTVATVAIALCAGVGFKTTAAGIRLFEAYIAKPKLVQETSRLTAKNFKPGAIFAAIKGNFVEGPTPITPIFAQRVREKVEDISLQTRNVINQSFTHRSVVLHGPPGTGKTLYAKKLARESSMHYSIMSGGDIAPMGGDGVTELNKLFDWSEKSRKGMVLFIDEADAFVRPREEKMSNELRSAINTFLARTGEPSRKIQIVLATNQIRQLDSAVLDRMNELVEVPLPQFDEREAIISQYMLSHVIKPANDKTSRVILGEDIIAVLNDPEKRQQMYAHLAEITEGMSGREMEKMCSNISASAVSAEDPTLSLDSIERAANDYKSQSTEKV